MKCARMSWDKLLSATRLGQLPSSSGPGLARSEYERDVDRVAFSSAFRRLGRKTQVHPLAANDHVHTRLTHSLETAQVGRTLGKTLGERIRDELPVGIAPHDIGVIVQAACMAHDLGNPPFGHAGEEAMKHWFEKNGPQMFGSMSKEHKHDIISCEGNAQGFRVLTQTENHIFDGGLRLTCATLGAYLKYPWSSRVPDKKFSAYISEEPILERVAEEVGLLRSKRSTRKHEKHRHEWCRHPLAYLVEAADDICYGIIDLEDAVELRILSFSDVWNRFKEYFDVAERKDLESAFAPTRSFRINLARLRGRIFDKAISGAIDGFMDGYEEIMEGRHIGDLYEFLPDKDKRKGLVKAAKRLASDQVFPDPKKVEIELGCYSTFESLLDAFCQAAVDRAQELRSPSEEVSTGWKSELVLKLLGDHAPMAGNAINGQEWTKYQCLRRVIDFVTGMTDNYATYISKQLQGMGFAGLQRP